jgi:hypothetical protein
MIATACFAPGHDVDMPDEALLDHLGDLEARLAAAYPGELD